MIQIGALLALVVLAMPAGILLLGFALGWPAVIGLSFFDLLPRDGMTHSLWSIREDIELMSWAPGGVVGLGTGLCIVAWCRCKQVRWEVVWIWPTLLVSGLVLFVIERKGLADFPNLWMRNVVSGVFVAWACMVFWVLFGPAMRWVDTAWARASKDMTGGLNPRLGLLASLTVVALLGASTDVIGEVLDNPSFLEAIEASASAHPAPANSQSHQGRLVLERAPEYTSRRRRRAAAFDRFPQAAQLPPGLEDVVEVVIAISDARRLADAGELEPRAALVEYRRFAEGAAMALSFQQLRVPAASVNALPTYDVLLRAPDMVPGAVDFSNASGEFRALFKRCRSMAMCELGRPTSGFALIAWPFWQWLTLQDALENRPIRAAFRTVPGLWPTLLVLQRAGNKGAHYPHEDPPEGYDDLDNRANQVLRALVAAYR